MKRANIEANLSDSLVINSILYSIKFPQEYNEECLYIIQIKACPYDFLFK